MLTARTDSSVIEYAAYGTGFPVTVFAHGLGGSIGDTRPLGSGVAGTRVFLHLRGHGRSVAWGSEPWDYPALGRDLRAVANAVGATRAVGVSLGGGALQSLLAETPDRFERCVFFLPGAIDRPRTDEAVERLSALALAVDSGDLGEVERLLADEVPADLRDLPAVAPYLAARARALVGTSVSRLLRGIPSVQPVPDRSALAAVTARCLVIGQEGDPLHPAALARDLAAALGAECRVFDEPGVMWRARAELRTLVSGFLNA